MSYTTKTYKTDLELQCSDGVSLFHSKYVLANKSSYIDAVLSSCEPDTNKIEVEYPSEVVEELLNYIDGNFNESDGSVLKGNSLLSLYKLSHKWNLEKFEDIFTKTILEDTITLDHLSTFKQLKNTKYIKAIFHYAMNVAKNEPNSPSEDTIKILMILVLSVISSLKTIEWPEPVDFNKTFERILEQLPDIKKEISPKVRIKIKRIKIKSGLLKGKVYIEPEEINGPMYLLNCINNSIYGKIVDDKKVNLTNDDKRYIRRIYGINIIEE